MTKKPETVKDKLYQVLNGYQPQRRKEQAEDIDELSPEAIEKVIALLDAIDRTYECLESFSPTEIFKPSTFKFEGPGNSDADNYFTSSIDKHREKISKLEKEIYDIWEWFEGYLYPQDIEDHWVQDILSDYEFIITYSYAQKFIQLPLEYVNESFEHDLKDFLWEFDSYFYARSILGDGYHFDLIDIWYKRNIKKMI